MPKNVPTLSSLAYGEPPDSMLEIYFGWHAQHGAISTTKHLLPYETCKYPENIFTDSVTQGLTSDFRNGLTLVLTLPQAWNKKVC